MSIFPSCFQEPAHAGLRLMGESDSTASQPTKPVCDWSVGRAKGEVKADFPDFFSTAQTPPAKPFMGLPVFCVTPKRKFVPCGKESWPNGLA
jgi:hypothetical protein